MMDSSLVPKDNLEGWVEERANKILCMAEKVGLLYKKNNEQMLENINERIVKGII